MEQNQAFLKMTDISKCFPGVKALNQVSLDVMRGEIHALVGENGAGKSTLMNILSGVYMPNEGTITLEGKPYAIKSPKQAQDLGIRIVHQELNLFPNLTVMENIFSGKMPSAAFLGFEDRKFAKEKTAEFLARFDLGINPETQVRNLSQPQQQVVEISKALAHNASVLILDEPTSSLTNHETERLLKLISELREDGLAIIFISHRLEEVFRIANRVTVLRDGHLVGTKSIHETDINTIICMMVGRELEDLYGRPTPIERKEFLSVVGLTSEPRFRDVSFQVRAGEILGMAGLVGAGRTDVGLCLFGARSITSGTIKICGRPVEIRSPDQAMQLGIAYLSENRQSDALFMNMDTCSNISVSHLGRFSNFGFINSSLEAAESKEYVDKLNIQTPTIKHKISKLSGGNQQKVILARWLAIQPKLLILDEPTRGIDVGAKVEIYTLIRQLAARGVAILLISSEMLEILGMSDRIIVMHEGRVIGELPREAATEERVMALATNQQRSSFV